VILYYIKYKMIEELVLNYYVRCSKMLLPQ